MREVEEVLAGLPWSVEVVTGLQWPEVVETEPTLAGNALLKARAVAAATGITALADDTGLEVAALGGAPGVRTARFAGEGASYRENVDALLAALAGVADRSARFRTVVAMVSPDGQEIVSEGTIDGRIAEGRRGDRGFGYDPVFEVAGRTFAEMESGEKHAISHRGRALRALVVALGSQTPA